MHEELLYAERVLRAGARGYLTKQEATRSILSAIRHVLSGEIYLSPRTASVVLKRLAPGNKSGPDSIVDALAERELQVFELTGQGFNTRQIARNFLSTSKPSRLIARALKKNWR